VTLLDRVVAPPLWVLIGWLLAPLEPGARKVVR
jgi:hypothetical protein